MPAYKSHSLRPAGLPRRTFLRAAGVSVALPWLSAMEADAADAEGETPEVVREPGPPRRFVAVTLGLGLLSENLFPEAAGTGWKSPLYLRKLEDLRDQLTLISGTSHPGVGGGHRAEASILTANPAGSSGRAKNTVSVDQLMAKYLGDQTRLPSLVLASNNASSPSYTESGSMVPAETSPSRLFANLFIDKGAKERKLQAARVRSGRSVMDLVRGDAKRLTKEVGPADARRLDEYFTSVRELELRMAAEESWVKRPKPKVDAEQPKDVRNSKDFIGRQRTMAGVIKLALETDQTRFVVHHLGGSGGVVPLPGVDNGYHSLSHHGLNEEKLDQLAIVEAEIIAAWGDFLRSLAEVNEHGRSLLDSTSVLLTSNLGNASNHDNRNMPVLFAGGGFKHGQHLAFDRKNNAPLADLYVSILQRTGLKADRFFSGTGRLKGLEVA